MIEALILLAKGFVFLKNLLVFFFINFIYVPGRYISRFGFYKIIVKGYGLYLSWINKIGWSDARGDMMRFVFNQKFVHVLVIFLTVLMVFGNFANKTKAGIPGVAQKTVLANLVQSEFGELDPEELVEEIYEEGQEIPQVQRKYLNENLLALRNEPQAQLNSGNEIEDSQDLGSVTQGGSALVKPEIISTKTSVKSREEIINYTVQSGDTISTIAQKFGISVNTILWENDLSSYSLIRPGQVLKILPFTGVAHTVGRGETLGWIANKYDVDSDKIMEANEMTNANQLSVGQKLLIPNGSKSSYTSRTTTTTSYTGVSAIRDIVKSPSANPTSGNKMNWPTQGHRITQYYSWRHHGLDIANKTGTPIYAADAGIIEYAGWTNGYGYNVLINHGGGKKTRYAHLSKFFVNKGDSVDKGENIAAMGNTGWSTGPHLHFEVIINGAKYNPLNYIK